MPTTTFHGLLYLVLFHSLYTCMWLLGKFVYIMHVYPVSNVWSWPSDLICSSYMNIYIQLMIFFDCCTVPWLIIFLRHSTTVCSMTTVDLMQPDGQSLEGVTYAWIPIYNRFQAFSTCMHDIALQPVNTPVVRHHQWELFNAMCWSSPCPYIYMYKVVTHTRQADIYWKSNSISFINVITMHIYYTDPACESETLYMQWFGAFW